MNRPNPRFCSVFLAALWSSFATGQAADDLPVLVKENFSSGFAAWDATDANAWRVVDSPGTSNQALELYRQSDYKPPHRSPVNIALLKYHTVGDFVLTAKVRTTKKGYGHRDMCLFFGYQDPAHFYYVHLGQKTDDHANQIFIVNDAPRTKISEKTSPGTPWKDDTWHQVKIVRTVGNGLIEVYFDDMRKPVMAAHDKTFDWGRIGLGSFDDTGMWDDVVLRGVEVEANQRNVDDHNKDGSHDWRDLTVMSDTIYRLEDTTGDGKADKRIAYASDVKTEITGSMAGVLYFDGDVYATASPELMKFRDTDGDGVADKRESIAHGFGVHVAYAGHHMHGLNVGPDGRIYWTIGDKGLNVTSKEGVKYEYPHEDSMMRCEPDGSNFEVHARGLRNLQEPRSDAYGNWFEPGH